MGMSILFMVPAPETRSTTERLPGPGPARPPNPSLLSTAWPAQPPNPSLLSTGPGPARPPNPSLLSTRPGPARPPNPSLLSTGPRPAWPPTPHFYWPDPSLLLASPFTSIGHPLIARSWPSWDIPGLSFHGLRRRLTPVCRHKIDTAT